MANKTLRWAEPKGFNIEDPEVLAREAKKLEKWYKQKDHYKLPSPYGFQTTSDGNVFTYRPTDDQPDLLQCIAFTSESDDNSTDYEDKRFTGKYGSDEKIHATFVEPEDDCRIVRSKRSKRGFIPGIFNSEQEWHVYGKQIEPYIWNQCWRSWDDNTRTVMKLHRDDVPMENIAKVINSHPSYAYRLRRAGYSSLMRAYRECTHNIHGSSTTTI